MTAAMRFACRRRARPTLHIFQGPTHGSYRAYRALRTARHLRNGLQDATQRCQPWMGGASVGDGAGSQAGHAAAAISRGPSGSCGSGRCRRHRAAGCAPPPERGAGKRIARGESDRCRAGSVITFERTRLAPARIAVSDAVDPFRRARATVSADVIHSCAEHPVHNAGCSRRKCVLLRRVSLRAEKACNVRRNDIFPQ